MDNFNKTSNLDFQKNPLDSRNLTGVIWEDALRKVDRPPLLNNADQYTKNSNVDNSIKSLSFIGGLFIVFLALMALTWLYRFVFG
ncbi:TPA: hypothetical protein ACIFCT_003173 [Acinetobacter baumannii]|uniref:Uncharacterized protein n=2 Tax=Acinetobacter baumannii TaxID=470 RepID=A0A646LVT1_ACIBA|nr:MULTISPECIES: hypothetical protein [Acinetobacter calcoaceticus/baumannii complex]EHU3033107.1 hypothetical protein [Acinetobacter baumannii]EIB7144013.1 hypothetical protein [Acinetobacter baumannii]EKK06223.1 hypothetical protein ACINIS235_A0180 [Acinetobacter baumannii IS-235]EKU0974528.1 hypothetical protein [Acinetobacter baumannii]EKU2509509.1 hypothetical protein [Acinetobacter baumannii]